MIDHSTVSVRWAIAPVADESVLGPDEIDRAQRFRKRSDRERFVASHTWLRAILGEYMGAAPSELQFERGWRGKPRLLGSNELEFSFSHSGDVVAAAVCRTDPVGIDVETVQCGAFDPRAAALVLSSEEVREVESAHDPDLEFAHAWTRKEAFSKVSGMGLDAVLRSITLDSDAVIDGRRVANLDLGPIGVVAAVAAPLGSVVEIRRC